MAKNDNKISIGIPNIYDEVPLSKNVENQKKTNTTTQQKTTTTAKKTNTATTSKTTAKPSAKGKHYDQCVATLKNFYEAYKALPKFELVIENLNMINEEVAEKREWMDISLLNLKTGKAMTYREEFNTIKMQADTFFFQCNNAMDKYNSSNIFEIKKDSIENMKKVFFNEKCRKVYESEGLKKEFEEAEQKVKEFLAKRDTARDLLNTAIRTINSAKKEYKNFEQEVENYFDRVRSK